MHIVFLGKAEVVNKATGTWLTGQQKFGVFTCRVANRLQSMQDLNIEWCRVLPFKEGAFGGWVSENHSGLTQVIKWFYSDLDQVYSKIIWTPSPGVSYNRWSAKNMRIWLSDRGVKGFSK